MNVKVCQRFWGGFLQKGAVFSLLLCCAFLAGAQTSRVYNGTVLSIKPGTLFIIKSTSGTGALLRNEGHLSNETDSLIIEGSFQNKDTTIGVGNAGFYLTDTLTNNGIFIKGQSTVFLNGANQIVKGSVPTRFHNLTLQGTGIKSLQQNASAAGLLNLNDLELATERQTFAVLNTDSNAILRTTGFVSSLDTGKLERSMNDSVEYFYPLGSSLGTPRFRPLMIRPSDMLPVVVGGRLANIDATLEGYDRENRSDSICGINPNYYHRITRPQGTSPVDITMFYKPAEEGLWSEISHWQTEPQWELDSLAKEVVDTQFTSLTVKGWSDFSYEPFALAVPATLLDPTLTVIKHVKCNGENNGSICVSAPITGTEPYHFTWSTDRPGDTTTCILNLIAGTYTLSVTDSFNCPNVYTFIVEEPSPIVVTLTADSVSCKDGSDGRACVTATGDYPNFVWTWSNLSDSICIINLMANTYSVTATDDSGCTASKFITVAEPDLLVVTPEAIDVSCFGLGDGQGVANVVGGTEPYSYSWSDSSDTETVSGLVPETYSVTVTDVNGCTATADMNINEPAVLTVTAGNDTTIFDGFTATLYVANVSGGNGNETYEWTPPDNVENPQSSSTSATPGETTDFIVTVTDANGCTALDTLRVHVDEHLYTFPDGFVPNSSNDDNYLFQPRKSTAVTVLKLEIFNRWGQLVGNDPTGWDGKYKGELQPMDTYIYQSVLQLPDGTQKTEHGDFILIW